MSRNLFLGIFGSLPVMGASATEVLAANLKRLMTETPQLSTQAKVAAAAKVDQKTISNCLNPGQRLTSKTGKTPSPTLAQVEKIAAAFGLDVWQLLQPVEQHAEAEAVEA